MHGTPRNFVDFFRVDSNYVEHRQQPPRHEAPEEEEEEEEDFGIDHDCIGSGCSRGGGNDGGDNQSAVPYGSEFSRVSVMQQLSTITASSNMRTKAMARAMLSAQANDGVQDKSLNDIAATSMRLLYDAHREITGIFPRYTEAFQLYRQALPNFERLLTGLRRLNQLDELNEFLPIVEELPGELAYRRRSVINILRTRTLDPAFFTLLKEQSRRVEERHREMAQTIPRDRVYEFLCDGELYHEHPVLEVNASTCPLLFYYDEVGSFGVFYIAYGCAPERVRNKLSAIDVVAVFPKSILKTVSLQDVLSPIVDELKTLESDGSAIETSDGLMRVWACLLYVLADNKAAHEMANLFASFSRMRRPCRFCLIHRSDLGSSHVEKFPLRDFDVRCAFDNLVVDPVLDEDLKAYYRTEYGTAGPSQFSRLPHFDYTVHMPLDIMHCGVEGEMRSELRWFLQHGKIYGWWTYKDVRHDLDAFRSDHPRLRCILPDRVDKEWIEEDENNLELNAGKIMMLAFMLPFILSKHMKTHPSITQSQQLRSLWLYLRIMAKVLQWTISVREVEELEHDCILHMQSRTEAYEYRRTHDKCKDWGHRPKSHYEMHYALCIRRCSVLRGLSSFRFESKHQEVLGALGSRGGQHNDALTVLRRMAILSRSVQWSELLRPPTIRVLDPDQSMPLPEGGDWGWLLRRSLSRYVTQEHMPGVRLITTSIRNSRQETLPLGTIIKIRNPESSSYVRCRLMQMFWCPSVSVNDADPNQVPTRDVVLRVLLPVLERKHMRPYPALAFEDVPIGSSEGTSSNARWYRLSSLVSETFVTGHAPFEDAPQDAALFVQCLYDHDWEA